MEFVDLKRQYSRLKPMIDRRIEAVLNHAQFVLGPEVEELEKKLAAYTGAEYCVSCASGTDALLIALMALGVGPGDEIITTPFSFIATAEVIALLGATPVFVDIDPRTYNLNPDLLAPAITTRTKVILPVALYGQCADYDAISEIAAPHDIPVMEDGAQSFGATYKGTRSGNLCTIGCTSFFPAKPLGCYGEGGACFTKDEALATRMRSIRAHGQDRRYHHPILGLNARLHTLQAAILLAKLEAFPEEMELRQEVAARYNELLGDMVITPYIEPHNLSAFAQYTIEVENRETIQAGLKEKGIPTAVHYPVPLHLQPVFANLGYRSGSFPVSEAAAKRVLSLPMHPYLEASEQQLIADELARITKQSGAIAR